MMMIKNQHLIITITMVALVVLLRVDHGVAITASQVPYDEIQPDGSVVRLKLIGNEYSHVETDMKGYTVVRGEDGFFRYAISGPIGDLLSSHFFVGRVNPDWLDLVQGLMPDAFAKNCAIELCPESNENSEVADRRRKLRGEAEEEVTEPEKVKRRLATPTTGKVKNLVIPIKFKDHVDRTIPSQSDLDILMNHNGPHALAPTGSVRDVFLENSYGQLNLESTVVPWIISKYTEAEITQGNSGLSSTTWTFLIDALEQLEGQGFDFTEFDKDGDGNIDGITFFHSGYAAETGGTDAYGTSGSSRIWSHKWKLNKPDGYITHDGVTIYNYNINSAVWGRFGDTIGRIGVIAHELGHFLGITDLYDSNGGGIGMGSWDLMAYCWGWDHSQYYPPHMSAWSKVRMGWIDPIEVKYGSNKISASEVDNPNYPQVYKVSYGYPPGEYLLIENRQPIGFDSLIPQGGLAIWHVDEKAKYNTEGYPGTFVVQTFGHWRETEVYWPESGEHYKIALLQADGKFNLEQSNNIGDSGDLFHGSDGSNYIDSTGISGGEYPDTNAYQNGNVRTTSNRIYSISTSGIDMTFQFTNNDQPAPSSSPPSPAPSEAPTTRPTSAPVAPTICPPWLSQWVGGLC